MKKRIKHKGIKREVGGTLFAKRRFDFNIHIPDFFDEDDLVLELMSCGRVVRRIRMTSFQEAFETGSAWAKALTDRLKKRNSRKLKKKNK